MKRCIVKKSNGYVSIRDGFYATIGANDKRRDVATVDEFDLGFACL